MKEGENVFDIQTKERKRVAIYARVSTVHEAQISALANQKDWYTPFLEMHPEWDVVQMYADEGVTGTSANKRRYFMQMIDDAVDGKFDMILTREVSRFARNTVDTLNYTRMLKKHMVEVYFLNDGIKTFDPDGELRLSIMATLAQEESRKISARVKYGQQTSMEKGVVYGNGNVMGYDRSGREYVANPDQREIVRNIFKWYSEGKGLKAIKWELEKSGAKTAMGKTNWDLSTISRILRNRLYIGTLTYHRQYTPDFLEQKKVTNHGEIEILQREGRHEHIISDELFEQVQRRLENRRIECYSTIIRSRAKNGGAKVPDVWCSKLLCACGHKFNRVRWHTRVDGSVEYAYNCYDKIRTGSVRSRLNRGLSTECICTCPAVPDWRLQMMACAIFRKCLNEMDEVFGLTEKMLGRHIGDNVTSATDEKRIRDIRTEIEKLKGCLDDCIERRISGELLKEDFFTKKKEYESRMESLEKTLQEMLESYEEKKKTEQELNERVRNLVAALKVDLKCIDKDDYEIPDHIIDAFVEQIVVYEDHFDWYLRCGKEDHIGCKMKGTRKSNSETEFLPSFHYCPTGSY